MTFSLHLLFGTILVLTIVERIPAVRRRRSRLLRPSVCSDLAFLGLSWLAIAQVTFLWVGWATDALHVSGGLPAFDELPFWAATLVALLLLDLGNYTAHWLMHRHAALWRFHAVHHSSSMLDWLATFRSHLVEQVFRRIVAPVLLILIGIPLPAVAIASAFFVAWGVVNHANISINLRFLEPIFITPRLHFLHHTPEYSDCNLGTVLNLWDRITGRFVRVDIPAETPLGNGQVSYPQTFFALMRRPFAASIEGNASPGKPPLEVGNSFVG
jgi:sterol desaturase/sphingolipid hydroxylase (fatty acid hydroxylase superfamily)